LNYMFLLLLLFASDPNLIDRIAASGRCVAVAQTASERVAQSQLIAPGPAPILSFRYFEDRKHHRFNNLDLTLDDAGH
jgi:hypothetical protein